MTPHDHVHRVDRATAQELTELRRVLMGVCYPTVTSKPLTRKPRRTVELSACLPDRIWELALVRSGLIPICDELWPNPESQAQ